MVLLTMVLTKYALIHSVVNQSIINIFQFTILCGSVLLITAGGYIINDIYDIEADKINKPNKVFIDKTIFNKNAWTTYIILNLTGLLLGFYISFMNNIEAVIIFIFVSFGLFLYSSFFKRKVLLGNILVSFFISLCIFIVFVFENNSSNNSLLKLILGIFKTIEIIVPLFAYIIFSFLTTLIREIIKDIEDVNGDLKINAKTLPIVIGRKRASKVAFFFSSILLVFLIVVLKIIAEETIFLLYGIVFILLPLLYFKYRLWISESKKDYSYLSKLMKIIMFLGIISMLLFIF
ncbi:4-hydroxybenzoate polyprenyltransferase [Lutibacter sp. Hel_I_33_5]|nr:4-hydroxybenzoate polyprenyltransferase [Lutibacter sp. Hel_I_33_5]